MKLKRFLEKGPLLDLVTDETLEAKGDEMIRPSIAGIDKLAHGKDVNREKGVELIVDAEDDAESGLPILWSVSFFFFCHESTRGVVEKLTENKTIDRVLDVLLIRPTAAQIKGKNKKSQSGNDRRNQRRIISLSPSPSDDTGPSAADSALRAIAVKTPFEQLQADLDIPDGLPLPDDELIEIEEWEILTGRSLDETNIEEVAGLVGWGLFKWQDLQYDQGKAHHYPPRASLFGETKTSKSLHRRLKKSVLGYTSTFVIIALRCL